MIRVTLFSFLTILISAGTSFAQTADKPFELPELDIKLTVEKTLWKSSEPAVVRIVIENNDTSKDFLLLPSDTSFRLSEGNTGYATMSEASFWSPVNLVKAHQPGRTGCQDDLIKEQISYSKDSKIRIISPRSSESKLLKSEKKELIFDLNSTCWDHAISNLYPSRMLFTMIDEYRTLVKKNYKVYFQMRFDAGFGVHGGVKYPMTKEMTSNQMEITVD